MKILHLSDLHIGNWLNFTDEDKELEKITEGIIARWGEDDDKPLIIITGDITDSGSKKQLQEAVGIFKNLKEKDFQLFFAPGNHDYGFKGNIALKKNFRRFKKYLYGIERISYPHVKIIEESTYNVALIGLNSMKEECTKKERFLADGRLGVPQLEEIEEILNDIEDAENSEGKPYVKIVYLHHHPFILPEVYTDKLNLLFEKWAHDLDDGEDLMNQISNKRVDALLFGHDHDHLKFDSAPEHHRVRTEMYKIPCILSCGKSTKKSGGYYPAWLLDIDVEGDIRVEDPMLV